MHLSILADRQKEPESLAGGRVTCIQENNSQILHFLSNCIINNDIKNHQSDQNDSLKPSVNSFPSHKLVARGTRKLFT